MIKIILANGRPVRRAFIKKIIDGYDLNTGERTTVGFYQTSNGSPHVLRVIRSTGIISKVPAFCRLYNPDMVIMGSENPGLATALEIHRDFPHIKLILIYAEANQEKDNEAEKAGILSFIYKRKNQDDLVSIIQSAINKKQNSEDKK